MLEYLGISVGRQGDEAFMWRDGKMTGLGIPKDTVTTRAFGVSGDGSVIVGTAITKNRKQRAFRWEAGQMVLLGSLPGGAFVSIAQDVSSDGGVIVGKANSARGAQAYSYRDGHFRGLGDLPGGGFRSIALAVSGDGKVVVGRGETNDKTPRAIPPPPSATRLRP